MNHTAQAHAFGPFTLLPAQRQLLADGAPVKLGARAFDVLVLLVQHRDRAVSKAELFEQVWPHSVVQDNNLDVHLWALRKVLGARAILNIPGRGYRFMLPLQGDTAPAPSEQPPPRMRTHLPQRLPALIGRDAELKALRELVAEHRLVTLTGLGGAGKTLLAQHLLQAERDWHAHGVCWVDLAPLQGAAGVAAVIAAALGLPLTAGDAVLALAKAAAPLQLLLALDSAELQVSEVATVVQALLAQAPGLRMVVTTQVPLQLGAERLLQVGPLAIPGAGVTPEEALRFGAVALFVERVQARSRSFKLDAAQVQAVSDICRRLDGSALAIELAAARVPLLGVPALLAALDARLALLTKGRSDAPPRQQTLRAALEWSHSLLNDAQRAVFRQLSVFAGGFSLEASRAVLAPAAQQEITLLDALDTLVDRCLLEVLLEVLPDEPPRYRLLDSPRALAVEQLAASGEAPELQRRLAHATAARFMRLHQAMQAGEVSSDAFTLQLEPELDDGRGALRWALQHDPALAVGLAWPLAYALGTLRYGEVEQIWQHTESLDIQRLPPRLQADWTLGAAVFRHLRRPALAYQLAARAVPLWRELGDEQGLARTLCVLASGRDRGIGDEQRTALQELRALLKPGWPALLRMHVAETESVHAFQLGDRLAVRQHLRRWMDLAREAHSDSNLSAATGNLADVALSEGDATEAVRLGLELERRFANSRSTRALATCRLNLTSALLAAGDEAAARATAERGWPLAATYAMQPYWLDALSLLAATQGRPQAAARLCGRADADYAAKGEQRQINEQRNAERARACARHALGEAGFASAHQAGATLSDAEVAALAFASTDVA